MNNSLIWCEVVCSHCGGLANASGYYSPARIKKLKEETRDWVRDKEGNILCEDCRKELEK